MRSYYKFFVFWIQSSRANGFWKFFVINICSKISNNLHLSVWGKWVPVNADVCLWWADVCWNSKMHVNWVRRFFERKWKIGSDLDLSSKNILIKFSHIQTLQKSLLPDKRSNNHIKQTFSQHKNYSFSHKGNPN